VSEITVVGGGIAGLVASIACAEGGAPVRLLEARGTLGGRGRSTDGPYVTSFGPHVLYSNGALWAFMAERDLLPEMAEPPEGPLLFRRAGPLRGMPEGYRRIVGQLMAAGQPPVEESFRTWASAHGDERDADLLARACAAFCFHHDPGELSAAFVWSGFVQAFGTMPSPARYVRGGWGALVAALEREARAAGVRIETGTRVSELPAGPTIVAIELPQARALLGDATLTWPSGRTVALDLGLRACEEDPFLVWDFDECGWVEHFTAIDATLAPADHELFQCQMGLRAGESADDGERRLEALLDASLPDWRGRVTFRRRQLIDGRTGALDLPGTSWRDRPAVERGDGVFLAGDCVAAPGLLSDPAVHSALEAARGALAWAQRGFRAEMSRL
jgi:hypothetical protein